MEDSVQQMLLIKSIDPSAHLQFSEYTFNWFVMSKIHIGDGMMLKGVCEHRPNAEEAIEAFLSALKSITLDEVLVTDSLDGQRRHWRWNGAAFSEQPVAWLKP